MKGINYKNVPEQATQSGDKLQQVESKAFCEELGAFLRYIVSHCAQDADEIYIDGSQLECLNEECGAVGKIEAQLNVPQSEFKLSRRQLSIPQTTAYFTVCEYKFGGDMRLRAIIDINKTKQCSV